MTTVEELVIRPIVPADKQALAAGFESLSPESRYARFLAPRGHLSEAELRYFTEIDHHNHEALVAEDPDTGAGVGVARYIRTPDEPGVAEMAVAVADDWHGRGVGGRLVAALVERAREEGVESFSAIAFVDNRSMLRLLAELGSVRVLHTESGTVEVVVDLPDRGLGRLREGLRAVARGEVRPAPSGMRPPRSHGEDQPPGSGR